MNDELLTKVESKTNVSKDTITDLAKSLEQNGLHDEKTIRNVIKTLSKITNKDVPIEKENKIVDLILKDKVPSNIDKLF